MDYAQELLLAKQFMTDAQEINEQGLSVPKYTLKLTEIANREAVHLLIEVAAVEKFNHDLARKIEKNTNRYVSIFYEAVDSILPLYKTKPFDTVDDPMDIFIEQRLKNIQRMSENASGPAQPQGAQVSAAQDVDGKYPPELIRRYEITFKPANLHSIPVRDVKAAKVGNLLTVRGIITRCTDVKPKIKIVCYTCDQCGCETFQPVPGSDFMPLVECTSLPCKNSKALGRIFMQTRGSKFVKYQEIKLQEHSDQVPLGNIPRSITIMAHGEMTRQCAPGDHVSISGVFLPMEKSSYVFRQAGLAVDTYIDAHYICQMNKTEDDELNVEAMSHEEALSLLSGPNFLTKLSSSIAPEIYGHEQLKKALLLLLVGGVDTSPYGMKVRGNINVCLVGDPGVAKSQLLSFIDRLAARSQYTTGRGSSGVGLTAAVLRDPITNELVLEGGALVLADKGICCIDEFDKMMDADRTAIHEVMEQQTVSIAKAGIMTTLNARVSILAAANPAYGRFNDRKGISENLQIPAALLSRFDLLWVIRDKPEEKRDLDLAEHVTSIHRFARVEQDYDAIDMKVMRRYIALCKTKNPIIPEYLTEKFVQVYLNIRSKNRIECSGSKDELFTSPRSLLAILRITTAFARLRLSEVVEEADLDAAVALYNSSRESYGSSASDTDVAAEKVREAIRDLAKSTRVSELAVQDILELAYEFGCKEEQIRKVLDKLNQCETIEYKNDSHITLIDRDYFLNFETGV